MNSSGCGVAGTTGRENGSDGKVSRDAFFANEASKTEKRAPKLSVHHALRGESRRVDSRGKLSCVLERLRSEGERRREARGRASYLALEAGLVGETLEADLVERIGRVAAGRDGAWRLVGASTSEIRARDRCREKVASTERRRWILPPQNRRDARAIETTRARNTPDELAEEDLLVRVEGLRGAKEWRGQIRSRRLAKPSAEGAPKVGAGSSLACRDLGGPETRARASRRGETHVDDQRQKLVDLSLEGERLGFLRHGRRWGVELGVREVRA